MVLFMQIKLAIVMILAASTAWLGVVYFNGMDSASELLSHEGLEQSLKQP